MIFHTPCPKCQKVDFIRLERVIQATAYSEAYYCGRCDCEWTIRKTPISPANLPPLRRPRTQWIGRRRK